MHELSIAQSIAAIAERHADGSKVATIHVKVGHLRQVVPSALDFAFELITQEGPLAGAKLDLEHVAAAGTCRACGAATTLESFPLVCSRCGGVDLDVTQGEELFVESLELQEVLTA